MRTNPAHSRPTRELGRQLGTLSSALIADIFRESSRQHRYTLFSIQIPYTEATPEEPLAHFRSSMRVKQANPANSFPILIRKATWGRTRMPPLTFPSMNHSGTTRMLSTQTAFGSHAGTTPRTLPLLSESYAGNPCTLSVHNSIRKSDRTNRCTST